jgi:hypothetical protein
VWWLILCVILTGLKISSDSWWNTIPVPTRVFVEEISIWVSSLSKEDGPHQHGQASPNLWGPKYNKKEELGQSSSPPSVLVFLLLRSSKTGTHAVGSPGLRPLDLNWNYSIDFRGPSACLHQGIGPLSLQNHISQSRLINLYRFIYPVGSLCLENPD